VPSLVKRLGNLGDLGETMTITQNSYKFATTVEDAYIKRVVEEAAEDTNFLVITEKDTVLGAGSNAIVLTRKSVLLLALIAPELTLAGQTLGEMYDSLEDSTVGSVIDDPNGFVASVLTGDPDDVKAELGIVREEIKRINSVLATVTTQGRRFANVVNGRTVRVTVEAY
jgi:hypothetical protein